MPTRQGRSVCTKCVYKKQFNGQHGVLYDFDVAFQDGTSGVYTSNDMNNPKFQAGVEADYIAEEKTSRNGNTFYKIKTLSQSQGGRPSGSTGGGSYKARPNYSIALEWGRKMFNSSYHTPEPWDIKRLFSSTEFLLGQLNSGIDRDALDTAVTIACARAMDETPIDAATLKNHINEINGWINQKKGESNG